MTITIARGARSAAALIGLAAVCAVPAPAGAQSGGTQPAPEPAPAPAPAPQPAPAPAPQAAPAPTSPSAPAAAVSQTDDVKLSRAQTKSLQRRLRVHADGVLGPRTRRAISRYQARGKLTRTGRPNLETLKKMRLAFAAQLERRMSGAAPRAAAPSSPVSGAVTAAMGQVGTPYASAGEQPGGFDCSGLTRWAFAAIGVDLPHSSFEQYKLGTAIERAQIQAGDLVFFDSAGPGASDVGIATGPTTVVSATTKGVMEHAAFDEYWGSHFVGARRLAP